MKKELIFLILFLLPLLSAANIEYTLFDQKTLVEIEMSQEEIDIFEFPKDFEISGGKLKYIDKGMIEKNNEEYFFIARSALINNSKVKVILPEGAFLNEEYFAFPKNYLLKTGGKNIVLEWENVGEKEIFVPYKKK